MIETKFATIKTYWNFDMCRILQRHLAVSLPQHAFLEYIGGRSNAETTHSTFILTSMTQYLGDSRKSRHTTKSTVKVTVVVNRVYVVILQR